VGHAFQLQRADFLGAEAPPLVFKDKIAGPLKPHPLDLSTIFSGKALAIGKTLADHQHPANDTKNVRFFQALVGLKKGEFLGSKNFLPQFPTIITRSCTLFMRFILRNCLH
jgi:hypothetical protein